MEVINEGKICWTKVIGCVVSKHTTCRCFDKRKCFRPLFCYAKTLHAPPLPQGEQILHKLHIRELMIAFHEVPIPTASTLGL